MSETHRYRGRFAPSPTGPLHMGSLLAALASFLDARAQGGEWLLRIEDIDPPREVPGASASILASLEAHGLLWDGEPLYQSSRGGAYLEVLEQLETQGLVFPCRCTRATLGPNGSCGRRCQPRSDDLCSLRLQLDTGTVTFEDGFLGTCTMAAVGTDLVLRRKDRLFAYALAVVVDDGWQGITDIVRGRDLLSQTPAQLTLLAQLGYPLPRYAHLPLLCNADGDKLSKQTGAAALDDQAPLSNLRIALRFLGQASAELDAGSPGELLQLAAERWNRASVALRGNGELVYDGATRP